MREIQADYLVVGCGAVAMAFVDTMLSQTEASFIIVDRQPMPGGHWNDAYPFVRLHQPSAFYGVASRDLGSNRIDEAGSNKGYYELASGAETLAYFDQVMRERFLPSGRVQYYPMCEWSGDATFTSLVSGEAYAASIARKIVDTSFFQTSIPLTHERKFAVDENAACIPPNALPRQARHHQSFNILGGGKTAMDTVVWLLDHGVQPEAISWVCPRASWLINRETTQPGAAFFETSVGGFAAQLEACAAATSATDLFERMEATGNMLRIDPAITPTMFHYATISRGEVAQMARVKQVIRGAHVSHISADQITLSSGKTHTLAANTLHIDCTATAIAFGGGQTMPIFGADTITLQAAFVPLATTSAAIIGYVEANFETDAEKNAICAAVPIGDTPADWMVGMVGNMMNRNAWSQHPGLSAWLGDCRLDAFGAVIRDAGQASPENAAILGRIGQSAVPAVMNLQKLISQLPAKS